MRIVCRKVLLLIVLFEFGLVAGWANAEDAERGGASPPQQIARSVEGSPPGSPANANSYTIQNDLLTGPSLLVNTARGPAAAGWMAPSLAPDLADPGRNELGDLDDEAKVQLDPNQPKSIELDEGVRGSLKAKSSGAMLGIAIDFW